MRQDGLELVTTRIGDEIYKGEGRNTMEDHCMSNEERKSWEEWQELPGKKVNCVSKASHTIKQTKYSSFKVPFLPLHPSANYNYPSLKIYTRKEA
jgi:hypothetical protein